MAVAARQLTRGDFEHGGTPAWSGDGKSVLITANRREDADYEPIDTEIYRVDLADGAVHALTDRRGPDHDPVVSPDGRHVAYLGFDDKRLGYQATQLYVMDIDGTHIRSLTAALDRDAVAPHWSGDARRVFFQYEDHGTIRLAAIDLEGKMPGSPMMWAASDVTRPYTEGSFSVAGAARGTNARFAYTQARPTAPPALASGTSARDIVTLTALNENMLGAAHARRRRGDRLRLERRRPQNPGLDRAARPASTPARNIRCCSKFTAARSRATAASFAAEIQLYAAAGYVVLYLNPRGSTGLWRAIRRFDSSRLSGQGFRRPHVGRRRGARQAATSIRNACS